MPQERKSNVDILIKKASIKAPNKSVAVCSSLKNSRGGHVRYYWMKQIKTYQNFE